MAQVRIGIIGAGYWAAYFYLPALKAHAEAYCVGVVRRNRDALEALRRAFNLEVATTDVSELLSHGCDGIIVASSHVRHREHAEQALEAGCHVLVEKPMTVTAEDARALLRSANKAGKTLTIAYGWNYSHIATWAMELVASGRAGRATAITGFMGSSLVALYSGKSGYGRLKLGGFEFEASPETYTIPSQGGGYTYGQLSHQLGIALSLVRSEPKEVFARSQLLPNGVDIDVTVSVEFEDGVIGSFSGGGRLPWGTRYPMDIRLATVNGGVNIDMERERADAYFSHEADVTSFQLEGGQQAFKGRPADAALTLKKGDGLYTCDGPLQVLIDRCLGRDAKDRAPAQLGVRTVAVMEAAKRSADRGQPVLVSEL
jgi:predicted dehydrogenase